MTLLRRLRMRMGGSPPPPPSEGMYNLPKGSTDHGQRGSRPGSAPNKITSYLTLVRLCELRLIFSFSSSVIWDLLRRQWAWRDGRPKLVRGDGVLEEEEEMIDARRQLFKLCHMRTQYQLSIDVSLRGVFQYASPKYAWK